MAQVVLTVPDISCGHCERTITRALSPVEGIQRVEVRIPARQVEVDYDPAQVSVEQMKSILQEEDYPVADITVGAVATATPEASSAAPSCGCCSI